MYHVYRIIIDTCIILSIFIIVKFYVINRVA